MSNSESAVAADVEVNEGDAGVEVVGCFAWAESTSFRLIHFLMSIRTDHSVSMYLLSL